MEVNITISLKERKNKFSITQARLNLKREWISFLSEKVDVCYNPEEDKNMFWIEKTTSRKNDGDNYLRKEKEIVTSLNTNKRSQLRYSLSLPSDFFKIFESLEYIIFR